MIPLDGIRVVALEQAVAAPLCSRHLADLGAEVIKIERPAGDFARAYDSVVLGESAYFVWLNQGKASVVLDLTRPEDREILSSLLGDADVFLHNLGPGAVDRLGFGWDRIHEHWPRLINCAISGYGQDGPYRDRKAFDLLLQAESGLISLTGTEEHPAKVGISIADISAGMYALSAVLAALIARARTGVGTFIDISMLECLTEWLTAPLYHQIYAGRAPARTGMRHNMIVPYGPYRVGDGSLVTIAVQAPEQWERLCRLVLRRPELSEDPRFLTNELRVRDRAELEAIIQQAFASDTRESVLARLETADLPTASLNDLADVVAHPQLAARSRWTEVDTPSGRVRSLAHPFNLAGMERRAGRVPALGADTERARTGRRLLSTEVR